MGLKQRILLALEILEGWLLATLEPPKISCPHCNKEHDRKEAYQLPSNPQIAYLDCLCGYTTLWGISILPWQHLDSRVTKITTE